MGSSSHQKPSNKLRNVKTISSFSGIATDSFVAVHVENYFQKPCVGKVNEVTDKQVLMQWYDGAYDNPLEI